MSKQTPESASPFESLKSRCSLDTGSLVAKNSQSAEDIPKFPRHFQNESGSLCEASYSILLHLPLAPRQSIQEKYNSKRLDKDRFQRCSRAEDYPSFQQSNHDSRSEWSEDSSQGQALFRQSPEREQCQFTSGRTAI